MKDIFTLLLGCAVHIILILLFEGIFLFAILYPILTRVAKRFAQKYNELIFTKIINQGFGNLVIHEDPSSITYDKNTGYGNYTYNNDLIKYSFIKPINTIIKACAIDEIDYIKIQKNMPFIIYGVLLFSLVIACVIIIILASVFKLSIDYKFVIVNSLISFALICGYAFTVLWFILATQPYMLDLETHIYKTILSVYNDA